MQIEKELLNVKEVATTLGLGVSTIWRQLDQGQFPKPIRLGGATRWRRADIEAIYSPQSA